jgi:hypothetical protein
VQRREGALHAADDVPRVPAEWNKR